MKTNYVLIDFENIQPQSLEKLAQFGFKVVVFVGANQTKVPFELANTMQSLGSDGEYIKLEGNGQNALDFHIAYYIGNLSAKNPEAKFHIISNDTGFDPLIKHLHSRKIQVDRRTAIAEIPILKPAATKRINENAGQKPFKNSTESKNKLTEKEQNESIASILNCINKHKGKPSTVKALQNTINAFFRKKLVEQELNDILEEMVAKKIISKNGTRITYNLPAEAKALPGTLF